VVAVDHDEGVGQGTGGIAKRAQKSEQAGLTPGGTRFHVLAEKR
jgi:hypothetical protein